MNRTRKIVFFLSALVLLLLVAAIAASAAAPLSLSPVLFLSGDEANGLAAFDQFDPVIVQGGDRYLVAWTDARTDAGRRTGSYYNGNGSEIYAARLAFNGNLLDATPIIVSQSPAEQFRPNAAWNGQNWLVVWLSQEPSEFYYYNRVMAARVSPQGTILDAPIPISPFGVDIIEFTVSSDGSQWAIVWQGSSAGAADLRGTGLSPEGAILDPGGRAILPETYYLRSDLDMAFTGDEYLLTWQAINVVQGKRLRPDLTAIDANYFNISSGDFSLFDSWVASNGADFFVVWEAWVSTTYYDGIHGARVSHAGQVLDPNGIMIWNSYGGYIGREPRIAWDGSNWFVSFMLNDITVLRVNSQGVVIDPNDIPPDFGNFSNKWSPDSSPAFGGGIQLAWFDTRAAGYYTQDIYTVRVAADRAFGSEAGISNGLPSQIAPNVAANGSGYLLAFRDDVSGNRFVKVQRVDANGNSLWAEPLVVASSPTIEQVDVAWNGSLYLVVWNDRASNQILGRRMRDDGTFVDPGPFAIMSGAEPEVAAIGDLFLVIGTHAPDYPQFRHTFAARVQGSTGAVLDQPLRLGGSFAVNPDLASFSSRWIAVWEQHPTHDDPNAQIVANFINTDGTIGSAFNISPIGYIPTVATDGTTALVAWQNRRESNSDLYGRRVLSDGTLLGSNALVTAPNNQKRASAAWDGTQFVLIYEDQRNNTLFYDPSTDVYATRVDVSGAVIDQDGFPVFNDLMPAIFPDTDGANGYALLAASFYRDIAPYLAYRVGMRLLGDGGSWPTATPTGTPTVTFTPTFTQPPFFTPTSTPTATPKNPPIATATFTPTATPTHTPTSTSVFTPTPTPTLTGCTTNCLRSTNITLSSRGNIPYTITGKITVKNENGAALSGAAVYVTWTVPGGDTQDQVATTNSKGVATFTTSGGRGVYTLTVTNITKSGYTFDPANSLLSKSITK